MKILLVTPDYPPTAKGGGGRVFEKVAEHLQKKGHQVTVLSGCLEISSVEVDERNGVTVHRVPLLIPWSSMYRGLKLSMPPTYNGFKHMKQMISEDYDVIHLFAYPHLFTDVASLLSRHNKQVLTIHALPEYDGGRLFNFFYTIYEKTVGRKTIERSDQITTISKSVYENLIEKELPTDPVVINNGIELNVSFNTSKGKSDTFSIVSITRIVWYKGIEYAIKAVSEFKSQVDRPLKYYVIGDVEDEEYYNELQDLVEEEELQNVVEFTGYISEEKKDTLLYDADAFISSSLSEGFGLVILEAMNAGTPVIATDIDGHRDILDHGKTGFLVDSKSCEEIAGALQSVHCQGAENIVRNARNRVKDFRWEEVVEDYVSIYRE